MKASISQRDLESLSVYLDGELSPSQRGKLEARLSSEPGLRTALEELRQTRTTLRLAPRPKRRRSFTLTPEMVRSQPRISGLVPAMRLLSAAASFLFVITIVTNFITNNRISIGAMNAAEAEMPAMENLAYEDETNLAQDSAGMMDKSAEDVAPSAANEAAPMAEMEAFESVQEEAAPAAEAIQQEETAEEAIEEVASPDMAEGLGAAEGEFDPSGDTLPGGGGDGMGGGDFDQSLEPIPTWTERPLATQELALSSEEPSVDPYTARSTGPETIPSSGLNNIRLFEWSLGILAVVSLILSYVFKQQN